MRLQSSPPASLPSLHDARCKLLTCIKLAWNDCSRWKYSAKATKHTRWFDARLVSTRIDIGIGLAFDRRRRRLSVCWQTSLRIERELFLRRQRLFDWTRGLVYCEARAIEHELCYDLWGWKSWWDMTSAAEINFVLIIIATFCCCVSRWYLSFPFYRLRLLLRPLFDDAMPTQCSTRKACLTVSKNRRQSMYTGLLPLLSQLPLCDSYCTVSFTSSLCSVGSLLHHVSLVRMILTWFSNALRSYCNVLILAMCLPFASFAHDISNVDSKIFAIYLEVVSDFAYIVTKKNACDWKTLFRLKISA